MRRARLLPLIVLPFVLAVLPHSPANAQVSDDLFTSIVGYTHLDNDFRFVAVRASGKTYSAVIEDPGDILGSPELPTLTLGVVEDADVLPSTKMFLQLPQFSRENNAQVFADERGRFYTINISNLDDADTSPTTDVLFRGELSVLPEDEEIVSYARSEGAGIALTNRGGVAIFLLGDFATLVEERLLGYLALDTVGESSESVGSLKGQFIDN